MLKMRNKIQVNPQQCENQVNDTCLNVSGEKLVHETIRQIMAARAIHNVFKMTESRMVVSSECMR